MSSSPTQSMPRVNCRQAARPRRRVPPKITCPQVRAARGECDMDNQTGHGAEVHPHPETARRMLAEEIRALTSATVLTTAGTDALARALALVRDATTELSSSMKSSRYDGVAGLAPGSPANDAIWE